jgi:two-component system, NtrC family, nitrogen regulation sensor histidine kinase NtrY
MASRPSPPRQRLSLGPTRRRLKYEQRIRIWLTALALPTVLCAALLAWKYSGSLLIASATAIALAIVWAIAAGYFFEQLIRPLQTLANVVSALREDDFSFRARGARRGDSLGDLALEINALAGTLQSQRSAARDALTLVERVMTAMQSPVLAFDNAGHLRLLNPAAESAFHLQRRSALGHSAAELNLTSLLHARDEALYTNSISTLYTSAAARWSIRRTTFRLHGVPHTLLVLSDVAAALREEERLAWQRLIRVLSHEINNSLTPIKSLAGSLRTRLPQHSTDAKLTDAEFADTEFTDAKRTLDELTLPSELHRGLTVIEERADSLNRFLQSYQQLTRLPTPKLQKLSLGTLLDHVIQLETRVPIERQPGPSVHLLADPGQLQQLLINLLRNAAEAALSTEETSAIAPLIVVSWTATPSQATLHIRDNGPGLINPANLFVPFYTTKPEGSGIGLVLAQQIATAHKGSITLSNNPDAPGCTAEFRLPAELEP